MKNALILHGTSGTPNSNWFPWLSAQLKTKGYEVLAPQLPDAHMPNAAKYNKYLMNIDFNYNSETIIIGHSSGAVAALQLLQALPPETTVKAVYAVGAFKDNLQWRNDNKELVLQGLFEPDLDYPTIRKKAEKFVFIHSADDPYCPPEHASYLAVRLHGELFMMAGEKHFNTEYLGDKYKEFPFLLDLIIKNTS